MFHTIIFLVVIGLVYSFSVDRTTAVGGGHSSMSSDVLVAGETLIDWVPERAGPLKDVAGFERRPGGAPANVAV
ncbi:carbohydrate kinase, partial [Natrinema soli]